jgi:hypothetical protein
MRTSCKENLDTGAKTGRKAENGNGTDVIPPTGGSPSATVMPAQAGIQEVGGNHSRIHGILRPSQKIKSKAIQDLLLWEEIFFSPTTTTKDNLL